MRAASRLSRIWAAAPWSASNAGACRTSRPSPSR
jgi:hypothetical protein